MDVRRFDREVDADWRRTSYSGLIRAEVPLPGVTSEREEPVLDDEPSRSTTWWSRRGPIRPRHSPHRWPTCPPALTSAAWSTRCSSTPTRGRPTCARSCARTPRAVALVAGGGRPRRPRGGARSPLHDTPARSADAGADAGRHVRWATGCASSTSRSRSWAATTAARAGRACCSRDLAPLLRAHLARGDPMRDLRRPARAAGPRATSRCAGYLSGSVDVVLRVPARRRPPLRRRRLQDQPGSASEGSR